jgi:hypothetical protein
MGRRSVFSEFRVSSFEFRKSAIDNRQFSRPTFELFAERQPLHLVGGADLDAVDFIGPREHGTINEPTHDLPVLD